MDKLFIFSLGTREMACEALKVHEVLMVPRLTTVANAPAFLAGVANLRGNIIPVVDTHRKTGAEAAKQGTDRLVVFKIAGDYLGFIVDAVKLQLVEGIIEGRPRPVKAKGKGKAKGKLAVVVPATDGAQGAGEAPPAAGTLARVGDLRLPVFQPETLLTAEDLEAIAVVRRAF